MSVSSFFCFGFGFTCIDSNLYISFSADGRHIYIYMYTHQLVRQISIYMYTCSPRNSKDTVQDP